MTLSPSSRSRASASRTIGREAPEAPGELELRRQAGALRILARDDELEDALIDTGG